MRRRLRELEEELSRTTANKQQTAANRNDTGDISHPSVIQKPASMRCLTYALDSSTRKRRLRPKKSNGTVRSGSVSLSNTLQGSDGILSPTMEMGSFDAPLTSTNITSPSSETALLESELLWTIPTPLPTPSQALGTSEIQSLQWPDLSGTTSSLEVEQTEDHLYKQDSSSPILVSSTIDHFALNHDDMDSGPTVPVPCLSTSGMSHISGQNTLHLAAQKGHRGIVELLLSRSSDINAVDTDGQTALHLATSNGHVAVAEFLLDKGSDSSIKNVYGQTALHVAAAHGHTELVRMLHDKSQAESCVDNMGRTPLYLAIEGGWEEVVGVLLESVTNTSVKLVT